MQGEEYIRQPVFKVTKTTLDTGPCCRCDGHSEDLNEGVTEEVTYKYAHHATKKCANIPFV